jgi:hypothetical protein
MTDNQEEKPEIFVDEDWKTKVQAEKEAWKQQEEEGKSDSGEPSSTDAQADIELPPASFSLLATTLAAQAMTAMGHVPDPVEKKPIVRLDVAKHYIDLLGVLEDKTKGNLTPDESSMLAGMLHELRMAFIAVHKPAQTLGPDEAQP